MKTALIVGATGVVGKALVELLCEDPRYQQIILWVRRAVTFSHPKILVQQIDFDQLENITMPAVDEVFCTLGTTLKKAGSKAQFLKVDVQYPIALATLAKQANVPCFVFVSAIGANAQSNLFYYQAKGKAEQALTALQLNCLQIARPSLILGERADFRLGEKIAAWLFKFLPANVLADYRPMTGQQIAEKLIEQAQDHQEKVKIYYPSKM
ncbi:NAD(P)H-binding protein [Avibacterium avium]|uniref:NAD(P)H-binding protein n=1 Tax=Avibacterium avium TaxID=751 RepID=UPI003BF8714C